MNLLKKLNLLLFGSIISFTLITNINADTSNGTVKEVCTTYTNYYFLSTINTAKQQDSFITEDGWITTFKTTGPKLSIIEDLNIKSSTEPKISKVCLIRDANDTSPCEQSFKEDAEKMTLIDFYNYYLETVNKGTAYTYTDPNSTKENKETTSYIYTNPNDKTKRYISHGKWYVVNDDGSLKEYDGSTDLSNSLATEMANASALPYKLDISSDNDVDIINNPITIAITRTVTNELNANIKPFSVMWPNVNPDTETEAILSPALYKVEYEACETKTVYTAKINYIDAKTKEKLDVEQYYKTNLENGKEETVTSPTIKNCQPDKEVVSYKIDNSNFETNVEYSCINENPKTGNSFVIIIFVIAIASFGYIVYYTKTKHKKQM